MAEAISTPGPYRNRVVSKPFRLIRVQVSMLTRPTEPSKGTVCMKMYAFSPSLAWMSSKSFSS